MSETPDPIEDPFSFQTLHASRQNLKNVESLSKFCFEACTELLRIADTWRKSYQDVDESPEVVLNEIEINRLSELAKKETEWAGIFQQSGRNSITLKCTRA